VSDAWIYGEQGCESTSRMLAELGFSPHRVAANGTLRPPAGDSRAPALAVVLASGLEQPSCEQLCARLAADDDLGEVPVLVAMDRDRLAEGLGVAEGHELLVEPFTADELQARITRARRAVNGIDHDDDDVVRVGSLEMNLATYQVSIEGRPVDFTYMEYELLKFLVTHPKRVFSREALLNRVWGFDYYGGARTVDVHVRRVRAKLGSEHAARIKTVRSVGYRWEGT
jgi:DNA-binding response OmpR family regulator